jgi:hypothetical protein
VSWYELILAAALAGLGGGLGAAIAGRRGLACTWCERKGAAQSWVLACPPCAKVEGRFVDSPRGSR